MDSFFTAEPQRSQRIHFFVLLFAETPKSKIHEPVVAGSLHRINVQFYGCSTCVFLNCSFSCRVFFHRRLIYSDEKGLSLRALCLERSPVLTGTSGWLNMNPPTRIAHLGQQLSRWFGVLIKLSSPPHRRPRWRLVCFGA